MKDLRVVVTTDSEGFRNLKEPWRALMDDSDASAFSTWEWLYTWWEYFGQGDRLFIITLTEQGVPVALFPHFIRPRRLLFGGRVGMIHTIGSDYTASDYLDFVIRRGHEEAAVATWMDHLLGRTRDWSLIEIKDIAAESNLYPRIIEAARERGLIVHEGVKDRCPAYRIDPGRYAQRLRVSKTHRRLLEYARSFKRRCDYRFGAGLIGGDFEGTFGTFLRLHGERSSRTGRGTKLTSPPLSDFLHDAARRLSESGDLLFTWLAVGDEIAAIHLDLVRGGRLYFYNSGIDRRWESHRVGLILFHHEMEHAASLGISEYLFLRGTEPYKYLWADGDHRLMVMHLTRPDRSRLLISTDFRLRHYLDMILHA